MAASCDFNKIVYNEMIRDKFVSGIGNRHVKEVVVRADNPTAEEALEEAQMVESIQFGCHNPGGYVNSFRSNNPYRNQKRSGKHHNKLRGIEKKRSGPKGGCTSCGKAHGSGECPARSWTCWQCRGRGHIAQLCRNKPKRGRIGAMEEEDGNSFCSEKINLFGKKIFDYINLLEKTETKPPEVLKIRLNDLVVCGEIDTGACSGVMSFDQYQMYFRSCELKSVLDKKFKTADGKECLVVGRISILLNKKCRVQCLVVRTEKPFTILIGRTWLDTLCPGWRQYFRSAIKAVEVSPEKFSDLVKAIKSEFHNVFVDSGEPIKGVEVSLVLKEGAKPRFMKAIEPPFSLKSKIEKLLEELVSSGKIERVNWSDWASQVVIAHKKSGAIRLCCNYKPTLNKQLEDDIYPMPRIDDIISQLSGNSHFCSLDLSGAYLQLALCKESRKLTTINTHLGLYAFKRLPFGVKTAPSIFQSVMDKILSSLKGVVWYFDDILVMGKTLHECLFNLKKVLKRLLEFNVQVNFEKCKFFVEKLLYLGHEISSDGVAPNSEKVKALVEAPPPVDVSALRSFMGLVNFYSKFIPHLQGRLNPLRRLLEANTSFVWTDECQKCFEGVKRALVSSGLLVHYDPTKPLSLICDASPYGVGAVLCVRIDGIDRPCYFASSSLSSAEKNYSQLHREALAVVFGVKKFHKYIYGYPVNLYTDCKALETLMSSKKEWGSVINSRFLRWLLFLSSYNLNIQFKPSKFTVPADAMSRLPLKEGTEVMDVTIKSFDAIDLFLEGTEEPFNQAVIAKVIQEHPVWKALYVMIKNGWPSNPREVPKSLKIFYKCKESLEASEGCIFYGDRIFIPTSLRAKVLGMVHREHLGVQRCKSVARSVMWWPGMTTDIEKFVAACHPCKTFARKKPDVGFIPWPPTKHPFERVHLDHFFHENETFLVIVDDFSGWVDVQKNPSTSTKCVVKSLKSFCAIFGLVKELVSDNGSCFSSEEFGNFCKANGIKHIKTPPYNPKSNGKAERHVGLVKENLKKSLISPQSSKLPIFDRIQNYLFQSHNAPLTSGERSGKTPAELIFNFKIITTLLQIAEKMCQPHLESLRSKVTETSSSQTPPSPLGSSKASKQCCRTQCGVVQRSKVFKPTPKEARSSKTTRRWRPSIVKFEEGQDAYYTNNMTNKWVRCVVVKQVSPLTYRIRLLESGNAILAHQDSLKKRVNFKIPPDPHTIVINAPNNYISNNENFENEVSHTNDEEDEPVARRTRSRFWKLPFGIPPF